MNFKNLDFLVKEIFVKIITKGLVVFKTMFLLFFFSVSSTLDNFYFSKTVIGAVVLVNILFEITYSNKINKFKNNISYLRKILKLINIFACISASIVIIIAIFFSRNKELIFHLILLCLWGVFNINSNLFLLINRFKNNNNVVLIYYCSVIVLDIILLIALLYLFNSEIDYLAISLSVFLSELIVFLFLFLKPLLKFIKHKTVDIINNEIHNESMIKVFVILSIVFFIDLSDIYFLSYMGEGLITYYTYGLYAPIMIRRSLDIRTNFFVQINKVESMKEIRLIFLKTLKKLIPFFIIGVIILIIGLELFKDFIFNYLNIKKMIFFKNIVYLGILITPLYMVWDLFYRFYYREQKINKLIIIVILGLILNIGLNFLLGIKLNYGIYGILISTLIVFVFYNSISYYYFFLKNK
ncbi:hypothetical protein [Polaribacter sp. Asnod6-C07]|uniref:hypothetical protein n=1 Tax=Polaribacter sp. Asnod6-C07 TaxID=3160582 RepID=UPI00386F011D